MPLRETSFDEVIIDDEEAFAQVDIYPRLRDALRSSGHRFRIPGGEGSWDRALFLNLTFWNGAEAAEVICDDHVAADAITHSAWHHLATRGLAGAAPRSADAMLFGEAIASAFDLYLVGQLLPTVPECDFITTQVPIMSDVAREAGLSDDDLATLLGGVCEDPARAFEDLRGLLFSAATALLRCADVDEAENVLEGLRGQRFEPLLHHYQLSNWLLYARAHGQFGPQVDHAVRDTDRALREAPSSLEWLDAHWLAPHS